MITAARKDVLLAQQVEDAQWLYLLTAAPAGETWPAVSAVVFTGVAGVDVQASATWAYSGTGTLRQVSLAEELTVGTVSGLSGIATLTHCAIVKTSDGLAPAGGNSPVVTNLGPLAANLTVGNGAPLSFPPGSIVFEVRDA